MEKTMMRLLLTPFKLCVALKTLGMSAPWVSELGLREGVLIDLARRGST